ncbi:MAG: hypothetical protein Q8P73_00785 [bacterium]|nr:hypothetical protein [bacterium]
MSFSKIKKFIIPTTVLALLESAAGDVFAQTNLGIDKLNFGLPELDAITVIGNAINWLLSLVAIIALAALIWGGIMYIASLGDENKAAKAKKIIFYAIIGVVVVGVSFLIISTLKTLLANP